MGRKLIAFSLTCGVVYRFNWASLWIIGQLQQWWHLWLSLHCLEMTSNWLLSPRKSTRSMTTSLLSVSSSSLSKSPSMPSLRRDISTPFTFGLIWFPRFPSWLTYLGCGRQLWVMMIMQPLMLSKQDSWPGQVEELELELVPVESREWSDLWDWLGLEGYGDRQTTSRIRNQKMMSSQSS